MRFVAASKGGVKKKKKSPVSTSTLYRVHLEYEGIFQGVFSFVLLIPRKTSSKAISSTIACILTTRRGIKEDICKQEVSRGGKLYYKTSSFHLSKVGGI